MATQKAPSSLDNLQGLLGVFKPTGGGTTTTSGGTSTQTTTNTSTVSEDQVAAIVKGILEGNSGMASVAPQQHVAGLYNSTTNTMLKNDLMARTAAEAAKLNKNETSTVVTKSDPKTVTTSPKGQLDAGKTALALLGSSAAKKLGSKLGLDELGQKAYDAIFAPSVNTDPFAGAVLDKFDAGSTYSGVTDAASAAETLAGLTDASSSIDYAGLVEGGSDILSSAAGEVTSGLSADFLGSAGEELTKEVLDDVASSGAEEAFSYFFADGGRVPTKDQHMMKDKEMRKMMDSGMPKRRFANGGRVNPDSAYEDDTTTPQKVKINPTVDVLEKAREAAVTRTPAPRRAQRQVEGPSDGERLQDLGEHVGVDVALNAMGLPPGTRLAANGISEALTGQSIMENINNIGNALDDFGHDLVSTVLPSGITGALSDFGGAVGDVGSKIADEAGNFFESIGDMFGFANGGSVAGAAGKLPGHDTQGKDDIPIKVSGGEYIIPTDVVDHLGEEFFDNLVGKFHTPIKGK